MKKDIVNLILTILAVSFLLGAILHPAYAHPTCHKHVGQIHCH